MFFGRYVDLLMEESGLDNYSTHDDDNEYPKCLERAIWTSAAGENNSISA